MNRSEIVSIIADEHKDELTKKSIELTLDALFANVQDALANGEKVVLSGFGTFEVRTRKARTGRNPRTDEPISIPAQRTPAFRAGRALKEAVRDID